MVEVVSEDQHSRTDLLNSPEEADKHVADEWCSMRARRVRIARLREKATGGRGGDGWMIGIGMGTGSEESEWGE